MLIAISARRSSWGSDMKLPVIRRLPSGNWFCQLRLDGQSISITEPTFEKCQARAMAYKTGILAVRRDPASQTLGAAMDAYIAAREGVCSPTTIEGYKKIRRQYFQDQMSLRLSQITERGLSLAAKRERQRMGRRGKPLSPKTIKSALGLILCVLNEHGIVHGKVAAPEVKDRVIRLPMPDQVIRAVQGTSVELPCLLAAWLSLSLSEIRGLTKSRSLLNGQLLVEDTMVRVRVGEAPGPDGKPRGVYQDILKEGGKEEKRSRAFDLPPYLMDLISRVDGDVLVPLSIRQIEGRFRRILEKNGLPPMTFHQLRHLNASAMAMLGIQKEIAQARGGWKTPHTMNRVYTHVFDAPRQAADQKIDAYFTSIVSPDPPKVTPESLKIANKKLTERQKRKIYRYHK